LQGRAQLKRILLGAAGSLTALLAAGCLFLPRGMARIAISDITTALLMLVALLAFANQGGASKGRVRWFWMLQAAGWTLWLSDQMVWVYYDLILHQKMPQMHPADALLFLAGAPMMAGLLLRPHQEPSQGNVRLGALDFLLLLLWWLYLYVSLVISWQYVSINQDGYNLNFDGLSWTENVAFAVVLGIFCFRSSGRWKKFYGVFFAAALFNSFFFFLLNRAIEQDLYFTGSWYDIPYSSSFALFAVVTFWGEDLSPSPVRSTDDSYATWMSNLAMVAVLSLPILAVYALLDPKLPHAVSSFRVLVTLATMFLMALVLFIQHRRLNRELERTNVVLQEASLTDPLTGLRNRRYFSATIEGDVGQALRSHTDKHDPHTRDLVFYLVDADNFKEVNDQYGHDVGDKVLVEMAQRLSSSIRHSDVLVRWGGEEFLIVSRYTDRTEAELLAQRVLTAVADTPFPVGASGETIHRTCSLGWAAFPWFVDNPRAVDYEEVLTLADRGLHRAKESGKNRAVGMLPASGKLPATTVAGLHSTALQVDVLAIAGPHIGA
jgi:diguanylate cyclase (GGDEF)-like protein